MKQNKMETKLSIIMPCYNCQDTLEQAFDSCFTQGLTSIFEIIMIDDCSTDETGKIIERLAASRRNVKVIKHDKNLGGGAARNTGIRNANGRLIYCLDSDNVFAEGSLQKMIDFLEKNKADGVAFSEQRFFYGTNLKKYKPYHYDIGDRRVELTDILRQDGVLLDNFLYTKEAYLKTAGYPENHGFDTQCFEIRFLIAGNSVLFCKETIFYHRHAHKKSYFERVYESGEFSRNYYLILEEMFYLLNNETQEKILAYNVFNNSSMSSANILGLIYEEDARMKENMYIDNYKDYLAIDGWSRFIRDDQASISIGSKACRAIYFHRSREYREAINAYTGILASGFSSPLVLYNILRSASAQYSGIKSCDIEKFVDNSIKSMLPFKPKKSIIRSIIRKLLRG